MKTMAILLLVISPAFGQTHGHSKRKPVNLILRSGHVDCGGGFGTCEELGKPETSGPFRQVLVIRPADLGSRCWAWEGGWKPCDSVGWHEHTSDAVANEIGPYKPR